jgi:tRNA-binding protein
MTETITYQDFQKVKILTGTIIDAKPFPEARKPAYQLWIDFGESGIKKSSAQITDLYKPKTLIGLQILAVVNFPSKQIANFISECLVLGVYNQDNEVVLVTTAQKVENGTPVC